MTGRTGDVLDAIDGSILDYETSPDAMRWQPEGQRPVTRDRVYTVHVTALRLDPEVGARLSRTLTRAVEQMAASIRRAAPTLQAVTARLAELEREVAARRPDLDAAHARNTGPAAANPPATRGRP